MVFYFLQSWAGDMKILGILIVSSYVFSFAFVESLIVLGGMVILSLMLPARFFKEKFVPMGGLLAILLGVAAYLIHPKMGEIFQLRLLYLGLIPVIGLAGLIILIFLLAFLFERVPAAIWGTTALVERMVIFVYIYLPLGIISLMVVFLRLLI